MAHKTCLLGLRPGPTQTGLYSHRGLDSLLQCDLHLVWCFYVCLISHGHFTLDSKKSVRVSVESDSDIGLLTGDTDNEGPEIVMPVQPEEAVLSGVDMETAESEDEITQIEDLKVSGNHNFSHIVGLSQICNHSEIQTKRYVTKRCRWKCKQ